jgi:hypothetical protein
VFDGAVLAGCVHCLKDQQDSPFVLRVKFVLQIGEGKDAISQRFLRSRLVCFLGEFKRVVRINIFETKIFAFANSEWLSQTTRYFDDFFCFHINFNR